ncbi:hypothetical protein Tco_1183352 [Tanacetum coccineum]
MNMGQDNRYRNVGANGESSLDSNARQMLGIQNDIMQYECEYWEWKCLGLGQSARKVHQTKEKDAAYLQTSDVDCSKGEAESNPSGKLFDS